MRSMSAPSEDAAPVWHYDGVSAVRRTPALVARGDGFVLVEDGAEQGPWPFADLVAQGMRDGEPQYGLKKTPGWRIGFTGAIPAAIASRLPGEARYGRLIDRIGLWPAVGGFAVVAALVVAGVLMLPSLVARLVPQAVEMRMGALMVGDFGGRTCNTPAGDAALYRLVDRLGPEARIADIRVVNVPMVNAVTLPGGNVLIFDGLLQRAASADEVAGVLGHELGHVAHRDVLESLIRQLGLSVVLGGLDGNVGGYTQALLAAGYSRGAEARADQYAIDSLRTAGISPMPTAGFFQRLAKSEFKDGKASSLVGYLSSHPMSEERRKKFAASAGKGGYRPVLSDAEWAALRRMCKDDPDVAKTEFRF